MVHPNGDGEFCGEGRLRSVTVVENEAFLFRSKRVLETMNILSKLPNFLNRARYYRNSHKEILHAIRIFERVVFKIRIPAEEKNSI